MEKNFNGYYGIYNVDTSEGFEGYTCNLKPECMFKVENNKITEVCAEEITYVDEETWKEYPKYELEKIIGENVKDFILNQLSVDTTSDFAPEDCLGYSFSHITGIGEDVYKKYIQEKLQEKGISERDFQQQMTSILQSKENKNALGKTDVLGKIAEMKGRTGEK